MNMNCCVYWVHLPNSVIKTDGYVGVSIDVRTRWRVHKRTLSCKHFGHAIQKYGEDLIWEVIFEGSVEGCYQIENYFRPTPGVGWNIAIGGQTSNNLGRPLSEETKKILSDQRKGNTPWWVLKGIAHSEVLNIKKRIATVKAKGTFMGENNPMFGRSHSEDAKAKISKAHKGKIGMAGKDNPTARKIRCVEIDRVFDTITEASVFAGCTMQNISMCLRGKGKTAKGYSWEYI